MLPTLSDQVAIAEEHLQLQRAHRRHQINRVEPPNELEPKVARSFAHFMEHALAEVRKWSRRNSAWVIHVRGGSGGRSAGHH